ncbi:phosphoserine aminotransferase [Spinactinospora alkalitolerans]|uniref:Phosphoserine aminotransferase n=1 Tax=Spinactinospora alkalitolerans TaxID=687207 RepID=A0A852U0N4_9ACTN|nr:antitoxin [Spinactinospora alkalitolerans]NYE49117.1 phosphoserine aminotransferase [Spinactinospora alkalitolerans]
MSEDWIADLLGPERYERVATLARERHAPVDEVIREAIDRGLSASAGRRAAAGARILAADPMPVGGVEELLVELDELRGRRA